MAESVPDKPRRSPRALGRRIGAVVYWAMVAAICIAGAAEVTWQVLFQPARAAPYASCHDGLRALFGALVRARDAAAHSEAGEDAALGRFRGALQPEWQHRDAVAVQCRTSAKDRDALDAIERLRYAEEHAVRREAGELAPLRRRVQAIVDGDPGGPPPSSTSDPGRRAPPSP